MTTPQPEATCDFCLERIGETGWMIPTGERLALEPDGPTYPVYRFYCSQACVRDDQDNNTAYFYDGGTVDLADVHGADSTDHVEFTEATDG